MELNIHVGVTKSWQVVYSHRIWVTTRTNGQLAGLGVLGMLGILRMLEMPGFPGVLGMLEMLAMLGMLS